MRSSASKRRSQIAAERRAILTEARRRRETGESARAELEAVTTAFERSAALEATAFALDAARERILDESIEPLEDLLAENWRNLFVGPAWARASKATGRSAGASGPRTSTTSTSVTARRW